MPVAALMHHGAHHAVRSLVAPVQVLKRQNDGLYTPDAAANTAPASVGTDTSTLAADTPSGSATDSMLSDPAAATPTGSPSLDSGNLASLSSAALAGSIPPAVLSDPEVQKAITSVAKAQGYDPDSLMQSASSILSSEDSDSSSLSDSASSSSATKIKNPAAEATDSITSAASSKSTKMAGVTDCSSSLDPSASSSLNGTSSGFNTTDSSFGTRINAKYGWVAVVALGAGYFATEGGL